MIGLIFVVARAYTSGQMAAWFYYEAKVDGYAVNARSILHATKEAPAILKVGSFDRVDGERAVLVHKGDRMPANATGVIGADQPLGFSAASIDCTS